MFQYKCDACKTYIFIDKKQDKYGVVCYKNKNYHTDCFKNMCRIKLNSKGSKQKLWNDALNNISIYENEAANKINHRLYKDELNTYLLAHYDITMLPSRFWNVISDLENGSYKQQKCKPVSIDILLEAWRWGQRNLDKININNKMKNTGPKDDDQRINYDLAILVGKIPLFLKQKSRNMVDAAEQMKSVSSQINIDYNAITETKNEIETKDIMSLVDDIF